MHNVLASCNLSITLVLDSYILSQRGYFILRKNISSRIPYCEKRLVKVRFLNVGFLLSSHAITGKRFDSIFHVHKFEIASLLENQWEMEFNITCIFAPLSLSLSSRIVFPLIDILWPVFELSPVD